MRERASSDSFTDGPGKIENMHSRPDATGSLRDAYAVFPKAYKVLSKPGPTQVSAMHPIITVASMKGGSGKSTVASCLAVHWQLNGGNPIVIDADPQRSIARLAAREQALGGVRVMDDPTDQGCEHAMRLAHEFGPVIVDTPGFSYPATMAYIAVSDLLLIPVKPSPLDLDRMLDMLDMLTTVLNSAEGKAPTLRCLLTQTTRDSIIARHIRTELIDAGFPLLNNEMLNRVAYPEAVLYGSTPSLINQSGPAAKEIAAIAQEVDDILASKRQDRNEQKKAS
jgi:chromosome partitioning protein